MGTSKPITGKAFTYLSSFASEQLLQLYPSRFGPDIEVSLINGRYQINAGDVNYSYGPLHDAFRRYFNLDAPPEGEEAAVLILGFGGGSVAHILRNERNLKNAITGVEVDPAVLQAGREHFALDKITDLELIEADAREFIRTCWRTFALIVVDIYINNRVPEAFETIDFLTDIKNRLLPGGKLVFNKLVTDEVTRLEYERLSGLFGEVFSNTHTFSIGVNKRMPNFMITGIND